MPILRFTVIPQPVANALRLRAKVICSSNFRPHACLSPLATNVIA